MLILGLLGMYFDAAVVFVTKFSLLFRLAVAILCLIFLTRERHPFTVGGMVQIQAAQIRFKSLGIHTQRCE